MSNKNSESTFISGAPRPGLRLSLVAAAVAAALAGCGSDGDGGSPAPTPTMLSGTVAVGAAVPRASVVIQDADGATADITANADNNGKYSIDVSSLKAPLVVRASGTLNGEAVAVVAVVPELSGSAANTANVTSLTHAVAALVAPGGDLNALSTAQAIAGINAKTALDASTLVVNTLKSNPAFASLLPANFDPLKTAFNADGSGVDAVLDQVQVETSAGVVTIANLTAVNSDGGTPPAPATLTPAQVATPSQAPTLPPSEAASNLPSGAEMLALAKKLETCLDLPIEQRVTLDANKEATAVSAACTFGVAGWKSSGGGWVERMGNDVLRYAANTKLKVGQPTVAAVLAPPNYSGSSFQHPHCNAATCVVMYVPTTTASGEAGGGFWQLAKVAGKWEFVGNQLPYAMGVEQRLNRRVAVNTALAAANPTNYFLHDRIESTIRLTFNPDGSVADTSNIRAVRWKGPGLPAAGVVTHRSQRCGTDDRFPITNQEGVLTVNNTASTIQFWNNGGATEFIIDSAKLDGGAQALPTPTTNWAGTQSPANQDYRSSAFAGQIPAWSTYTAEIYYFTNTGTTPNEVVTVRNSTPFEPAAAGAAKKWPALAQGIVDDYLKPTGAKAGSLTTLAHTLQWTNPDDGYVNFGYLFSQNREQATNSQNETATYAKRGSIFFRIDAAGDSSAPGYEWAANLSGTSLSPSTANSGTNPNPRCGPDEVLPLDADNSRTSLREIGLQVRGPDRKLRQQIQFWSN